MKKTKLPKNGSKFFMLIPVGIAALLSIILTVSGCARANPGRPVQTSAAAVRKATPPPSSPSGANIADPAATTAPQITEALKSTKHDLKNALTRVGATIRSQPSKRSAQNENRIADDVIPLFVELFKGNNANTVPLMALIASPQLVLTAKSDGSCVDNNAKTPNEICINAGDLARVPQQNLRLQLLALAIHGISHSYAFDEKSAVKLQNFVIENSKLTLPNQGVVASLEKFYDETNEHLFKTEYAITDKPSADKSVDSPGSSACSELGELKKVVQKYSVMGLNASSPLWFPNKIVQEISVMDALINKSLGFCADPSNKDDRVALINVVTQLTDEQVKVSNYLAKFTDADAPAVYHSFDDATTLLTMGAFKAQSGPLATPLEGKDVGCLFVDEALDKKFSGNSAKTYPPFHPTRYEQTKAGSVYNFSFSNSVSDKNTLIINGGFRDSILPNNIHSGMQLLLFVSLNDKDYTKNLEVTSIDHAMVTTAETDEGLSKVPTTILRRGDRESFQIKFKIPDPTPGAKEPRAYALRCEILKPGQAPNSVKIK